MQKAIDKDSVNDIKYLKSKYGAEKEFKAAKEYLNRKAKEVWDVFENRNKNDCSQKFNENSGDN